MNSIRLSAKQRGFKWLVLVSLIVFSFVLAVLVQADNKAIDFEAPAYTTGTIDGQNGWAGTAGGPINPAIDQSIVINGGAPPSFGGQSWRFSNAYVNGSFGDWPFSPSLANEAGESQALNGGFSGGTRQNHYEVQWDVVSTLPATEQPGLKMSTAPDRGDGARMSYIRTEDGPGGLSVFFLDYEDNSPYGDYGSPSTAAIGCGPEDNFFEYQVASNLPRNVPHTIRLTIDFVDGPRNDVVKVYIDGVLRKVGTTWEDYFRWCTESGGGTGTTASDQSRTVDSQIFQARAGSGACDSCLGYGFLIDNLSYLSSNSSGAPSTVVSMGPQAMEGDLKVRPGDTLNVGYDFTMPGSHAAALVSFLNSKVTFQYTCVSSPGTGSFAVSIPDQFYSDPQNSAAWYPSGDQHSPLVYQGSISVPDVCGGGLVRLQKGGTFSTIISSTDNTDKVNIRWHYSANGSAGGWSGTKSVVPQ